MCCGLKLMGVFPLLPVTILLTISFFVLAALRNIETKALRGFGLAVTALLWISAIAILSFGPKGIGKCPMMQGRPPMMMQAGPGPGQIPPMMKDCQKARMQQAAPAEAQKEKPGAKKNF